jgi:predicted Mrr-cat superfamily restriction endonuclease
MQRCWVLKTREDKHENKTIKYIPHWEDFMREQVIAIGWSVPQDPSFILEELVEHIRQHSYPSDSSTVRAKPAAQKVWKFVWEMDIGDRVLMCTGYAANAKNVHIDGVARVTGEFVSDKCSTWFKNKRKSNIVPVGRSVPRERLAGIIGLQACLHAIHKIDCDAFDQLLKWLGIHDL